MIHIGRHEFHNRQQKLLHNLQKYKIRYLHVLGYLDRFHINTEPSCKHSLFGLYDNSKYKTYDIYLDGTDYNCDRSFHTLPEVLLCLWSNLRRGYDMSNCCVKFSTAS